MYCLHVPREPGQGSATRRSGLWSRTASKVHPGHCMHFIFRFLLNLLSAADSRKESVLWPESGIHGNSQGVSNPIEQILELEAKSSRPQERQEGHSSGSNRHAPSQQPMARQAQPAPASFRTPPNSSQRDPSRSLSASPGSPGVSQKRACQSQHKLAGSSPSSLRASIYVRPLSPPRPCA